MEGGQSLLAGRLAEVHVCRQRGACVGHDKLDKGVRVVGVEEEVCMFGVSPLFRTTVVTYPPRAAAV